MKIKCSELFKFVSILRGSKYPYLKIHKGKMIATNEKIVLIKKIKKILSKKPIFIHYNLIAGIPNTDNYFLSIRVKDTVVVIKNGKKIITVKNPFETIDFPHIATLKKRVVKKISNSFSISRKALAMLLTASSGSLITFSTYKNSLVCLWKDDVDSRGYFARLK